MSAEVKAEPSSVAMNALRHVVESNAGEELVKLLEQHDVWQKIPDEEKYWEGYIVLARLVSLRILLLCIEYFCDVSSVDVCTLPAVMISAKQTS